MSFVRIEVLFWGPKVYIHFMIMIYLPFLLCCGCRQKLFVVVDYSNSMFVICYPPNLHFSDRAAEQMGKENGWPRL